MAPKQKTPKDQSPASSFCSHLPLGFGYLPMLTRFDPTTVIRDQCDWLSTILVPTALEIAQAVPLRITGESPGFQSRGETEPNGVQALITAALNSRFNETFVNNGQLDFKSRGLCLGIGKDTSYNDMHIQHQTLYPAVLEIKGSEASVLPAVAQSAASATNFVLHMINSGVPREKCVVSVVASTGMNICFGATILLSDSFPTYVPLSKNLDLLDDSESRTAAAHFEKIVKHAHDLGEMIALQPCLTPFTDMLLDMNSYYVKRLIRSVFDRGLGLFSPTGDIIDIQDGLNHMIWCLNRLYHSEARHVPEYPLSVRTPNIIDPTVHNDINFYELIYRNLSPLGYLTGTPDRVNDPELYNRFVVELKRVVGLVHAAGVIHVDLYASNIMWKSNADNIAGDPNSVCIKIVDWDASHCMEEGDFAPKINELLADRIYANRSAVFGPEHDLRYLRVYEMPIDSADNELWHDLASNNKQRIDSAFQDLMTSLYS